jgi:DnaK suppressor protein
MMQRVDNPQARRLMVSTPRLDTTFLEQQKRRLTALRQEILSIRQRQQGEQTSVNTESSGQARDYEDDAQRLAALELQDNLVAHDDERLSNIERALQKIDEGTYGLSAASGKPIAVERLKAFPEALYTEEEQRQRENSG